MQFNPQEDIYDSDALLKAINDLKIEEMENIISKLNALYQKKGEYESIIIQIKDVENTIEKYSQDLLFRIE